ncbi:MAG: PadR family transcriptional regulator [Chloroflexota bacterium]|nr:PadR family transcriptional regulator [Chloroflexota bacterium]
MPTDTVRFRYFVLGLLARQSMSGYDIRRFLKGFSWLIGSPSFGSLYPVLHALLEEGLVTVVVFPSEDKPPRKTYTITEAGRQVLQRWLNQPVGSGAPLKAFVMRLILASNFSRAGLIAHLEQRRTQVAAHHADLEQTANKLGEVDLGQDLALGYGLAIAAAELAWLDSALELLSELPQQPLPTEVVKGDGVVSTV